MLSVSGPPESWSQRLIELFKRPRTGWEKIARAGWSYVFLYFLVTAITAFARWTWPAWLRPPIDTGFGVALVIVSIWWGGIFTDFYSKLTGFGIIGVRENRRGQDPNLTGLWMERIERGKRITIVGTLSKGWFVQAPDNLDDFLHRAPDLEWIRVYLLDPFGEIWRAEVESGGSSHADFFEDVMQVLRSVHKLAVAHRNRFQVHFYDSDPISCVMVRGAIYLGLYLPRTSRKESPELTISLGSFLGDKLDESVTKLLDSAPRIFPNILERYREIMRSHSNTTREAFWSDPRIYCEFCKELLGLPNSFSRRHPHFNGSRMIPKGHNFVVAPTLGQLVTDHALVVSRDHVTASARLGEPLLRELEDITQVWSQQIANKDVTPLVYEHGIPSEDASFGGCGICHCHLHLVPLVSRDINLQEIEQFLREHSLLFEKRELDSWSQIAALRDNPYLCVRLGDAKPQVFVFQVGQKLESQLMRRFIAVRQEGRVQWDWRATPRGEDLKKQTQTLEKSTQSLQTIFR